MNPNSIISSVYIGTEIDSASIPFPVLPKTTIGQFLSRLTPPTVTLMGINSYMGIWQPDTNDDKIQCVILIEIEDTN
jgi:hypothetical protein